MGTWNHVKNELVPKYWKRNQVGMGTLHTWTHRYTYPSQSPASSTDKMGTQMQKSYVPNKGEEKSTISMTEVLRQKRIPATTNVELSNRREHYYPERTECTIVQGRLCKVFLPNLVRDSSTVLKACVPFLTNTNNDGK